MNIKNENYKYLICEEHEHQTESIFTNRITKNNIMILRQYWKTEDNFLRLRFRQANLKIDNIDVSNLYNKFSLDYITSENINVNITISSKLPTFSMGMAIIPRNITLIDHIEFPDTSEYVLQTKLECENNRHITKFTNEYYGILNHDKFFTVIGFYDGKQFDINSIVVNNNFDGFWNKNIGGKNIMIILHC